MTKMILLALLTLAVLATTEASAQQSQSRAFYDGSGRRYGGLLGCSRKTCVPHRTLYQPRGRRFTMRSNSA
jgi:hypothetical protein